MNSPLDMRYQSSEVVLYARIFKLSMEGAVPFYFWQVNIQIRAPCFVASDLRLEPNGSWLEPCH